MMHSIRICFACLLLGLLLTNCQQPSAEQEKDMTATTAPTYEKKAPEWSKNLAIYEVNIRQYSPEGTFRAVEEKLEELADMGLGILWLMPIHPIGEVNRKGSMGSYYAVKDYKAVNPEFGTLEDLKSLVDKAHELGMYVIIDWVANHTAWDNPLTETHPQWYNRDSLGNFMPPVEDWSDVIDLNYEKDSLWHYQIEALSYWVEEADIDGYRCDVADMVPIDFWNRARQELDQIKPVFMLAESETPALHDKAFDMTYAWELHHAMNKLAQGEEDIAYLDSLLKVEEEKFDQKDYRMLFTSNHDENSWNGTVFERLGEGAEVFAVLSATLPGMPLIYSGQEAGMDKRLAFFEKDPIEWKDHPFRELYTKLIHLKRENSALWNGLHGGEMKRIETGIPGLFAFIRRSGEDEVLAIMNLSGQDIEVELTEKSIKGTYYNIITEESHSFNGKLSMELGPWEYRLYRN